MFNAILKKLLDLLPFNGLKTALGVVAAVIGYLLGPDGAAIVHVLPAGIAHALMQAGTLLASLGFLHGKVKTVAAQEAAGVGPDVPVTVAIPPNYTTSGGKR